MLNGAIVRRKSWNWFKNSLVFFIVDKHFSLLCVWRQSYVTVQLLLHSQVPIQAVTFATITTAMTFAISVAAFCFPPWDNLLLCCISKPAHVAYLHSMLQFVDVSSHADTAEQSSLQNPCFHAETTRRFWYRTKTSSTTSTRRWKCPPYPSRGTSRRKLSQNKKKASNGWVDALYAWNHCKADSRKFNPSAVVLMRAVPWQKPMVNIAADKNTGQWQALDPWYEFPTFILTL